MNETQLDQLLERFYPETRKKDGTKYSKSSLVGIRASLSRHLTNPPYKKDFKIMDSPAFVKSNKMLFAVIKDLKREGLDQSKHYPAIQENDLAKIKDNKAFDITDPKQLQEKFFFDIQYNFGRRGMENLRNFKKTTFIFKRDDTNREFIEMSFNEMTKNHQTNEKHNPKTRMYAHESQENCPISSLKKYLSKLDDECDIFFTYPKKNIKDHANEKWYTSKPLGSNTLCKMMGSISTRLGLSMQYTNHSIRATTVTQLSKAGFEARQIMRVTGHKVESSLTTYSADNSEREKRIISDTLMRPTSSNFHNKTTKPAEIPSEIATKTTAVVQNIFYNYNCKIDILNTNSSEK